MAKPTPHSALESMGFKLVGSGFNGSSDRIGTAMTHHYTMTRNTVGDKPSVNNIVRPITHHVFVDEFGKNPGRYNVSYHVTQGGRSYSDGDYDTLSRHQDNARGGVKDPIAVIMRHHQGVSGAFKREKPQPLVDDVSRVNPSQYYHMTPGWGEDDPGMKNPRYLRPGPEHPMTYLNSAQDQPLDPHVHNTLTKSFDYMGRISPDDPDTDVYHVSYEDPEDPYMRYGFTVRHMPNATSDPVKDFRGKKDPVLPKPLTFSYDATHYPTDMGDEDGEHPVGKFLPVSSEGTPVANFTRLGPLVERHHNMLRSIGLMDLPPKRKRPDWHFTANTQKQADEFDNIISGNGAAGPCWSCGKATYNYPEGRSLQSDQSSPVNAHEETGGEMHGPDINLCGDCATNDMNYHMAVTHGSRGPGKVWHYNDQGVPGCPECQRHLMDQADDDLQP
jgi:hypothetical protein